LEILFYFEINGKWSIRENYDRLYYRYIVDINSFQKAPNEEKSAQISKALLEEKLVACCNIISQIKSMYWWNNEICVDQEYLIIIKTIQSNCEMIIESVKKNHSYQVPEVKISYLKY